MDRHKIIDKIHKCLRLSESGNANEAASALRQAQGMMRKYGICQTDLQLANVQEASATSGGYYNPPYWAVALSELVAQAFDCRAYISRREDQHPQFRFIGVEYAAQVAAYTFTILYRQLRRARRDYMQALALEDTQEARRRGNVFAQAWLFHIARVVAEYAGSAANRVAVDDYVQKEYGDPMEFVRDPTDPQARDYEVILSGLRAAHEVRLFVAMHDSAYQKEQIEVCA